MTLTLILCSLGFYQLTLNRYFYKYYFLVLSRHAAGAVDSAKTSLIGFMSRDLISLADVNVEGNGWQ